MCPLTECCLVCRQAAEAEHGAGSESADASRFAAGSVGGRWTAAIATAAAAGRAGGLARVVPGVAPRPVGGAGRRAAPELVLRLCSGAEAAAGPRPVSAAPSRQLRVSGNANTRPEAAGRRRRCDCRRRAAQHWLACSLAATRLQPAAEPGKRLRPPSCATVRSICVGAGDAGQLGACLAARIGYH